MQRGLLLLLPNVAYTAVFFGGLWLLGIETPRNVSTWAEVAFSACILAALIIGTVAHELGHAVAVRLLGGKVVGVRLGGKLASVTFHLGTIPVSVGLGLGGSVSLLGHRLSAGRRAAILSAGPAVNVLMALLCLLLPVPRWQASYLAVAVLALAVQDLVPGHNAAGDTTDGYKLLQTRAPRIVHILSWKLLASGDLPAATADLAASRTEWVIDHLDKEHPDQHTPLHNARHTLALARLRQRRPQEVQRLCADALAAELESKDRATALATVAMARHALLLSGRQQLDEALALDPDAELVSEAARFLDGGWETALAAHDETLRRVTAASDSAIRPTDARPSRPPPAASVP
jgi:hypothetical protein